MLPKPFAARAGSPRVPIEFREAGGARLRVRTGGSGARAIVFALDPPTVLEHYAQPFIAFGSRARLVAVEPPGFGHSKAPPGYGHTLDEGADVMIALLEKLALPRPVLAFPCLGAYVALRVAARRPDLVGGLVLAQAPSWEQEATWAKRVDARGILRTPILGQAALLLRSDAIVKGWYETAVADPARAATMGALASEALDHGAKFPLATAFQALFRGDAPTLAAPACPTLLVWGRADRSHRRSDPESLAATHAPGASIVTFDDAGHFPELEQPVKYRDAVLAWMDEHTL